MSTSNTYRPRRRVQRSQSRKPNCSYCKEDGHWMKHRSGEAICPKLKAKATHRRETNHSLAEHRRQAIAAGEWVASQGRSAQRQPRKRTNARPAVNRFEIPSDTESDEEDHVPITQPKKVTTGAWASGASKAVKSEGTIKPSQALVQKRSDEQLDAIRLQLEELRSELLSSKESSDGSWADEGDIAELEDRNRRPRRSTHNIPSINKPPTRPARQKA